MKNNVLTYFLYAIGEIILVVVGILVAVQIDNWNEERKEKEKEKETILNLKNEFEENLSALEFDMTRLYKVIQNTNYLYELTGPDFEIGSINIDSILSETMSFPTWSPSDFVMNDIKNSGLLKSMTNDSLKNLLLEWDRLYSDLQDWHAFYEDRSIKYFDFLALNGNTKNTVRYAPGVTLIEKSRFLRTNHKLMKQVNFENHLMDKLITSSFVLGKYQSLIPKIDAIISTCEEATKE